LGSFIGSRRPDEAISCRDLEWRENELLPASPIQLTQ
jgi:hypothetical protein